MKKSLLALTLATTALIGAAPLAHATDTEEFLKKAANSGLFEVQSSQLALQRATNADVKAFAQQMVDDHTRANNELKAAAVAGGIQETSIPTTLDDKHADKLKDLNDEDADDFDEEYLDDQETAHEKAVSLFKDYADDGDNASLKAFAAKTVPALEAHLDHVRELDKKY